MCAVPSPTPARETEGPVEVELSPVQPRAPFSSTAAWHRIPVEARLLDYGRQYANRMKEKRAQKTEAGLLQEYLATRRPGPAVQKTFSRSSAVERMELEKNRAARSAANQQSLRAELRRECTHRPVVSSRSASLAKKRKEKENVAHLSTVEALYARLSKPLSNRQEQDGRQVPPESHRPVISRYAQGLHLSAAAPERLYKLAKERREVVANAQQQLLRDISNQKHTPTISAKAAAMKRCEGHSAHEALYARALEWERARAEASAPDTHSFRPTVDPTSAMIASRLRETTTERLTRQGRYALSVAPAPKHVNPVQRARSGSEPRAVSPRLSLSERSAMWLLKRDQRLTQRRRSQELEVTAACTFQPKTKPLPRHYGPTTTEEDIEQLEEYVEELNAFLYTSLELDTPQEDRLYNPQEIMAGAADALAEARAFTIRTL